MSEMDEVGVHLLAVMAELAKDRQWSSAWGMLTLGNPEGAAALAEWIAAQSPERRAELCLLFAGHELYPQEEPRR